jgi:hypothetical protein
LGTIFLLDFAALVDIFVIRRKTVHTLVKLLPLLIVFKPPSKILVHSQEIISCGSLAVICGARDRSISAGLSFGVPG